jgi:hypothetical protein
MYNKGLPEVNKSGCRAVDRLPSEARGRAMAAQQAAHDCRGSLPHGRRRKQLPAPLEQIALPRHPNYKQGRQLTTFTGVARMCREASDRAGCPVRAEQDPELEGRYEHELALD